MYKKFSSRVHIPVLLLFLFLFSASQASAVPVFCRNGRVNIIFTLANGTMIFRETTIPCETGFISIELPIKRILGPGPFLPPVPPPIAESETGRKFLAALKKISPGDLKLVAVPDEIKAEVLERHSTRKQRGFLIRPGIFRRIWKNY